MMKLLFFLISLFFISAHPFYSSGILLLIVLTMLLILNFFGGWLNYILCMIYLSGILIMFMYISSLLPKLKSYFHVYFLLFLPLLLLFIKGENFVHTFNLGFTLIFYSGGMFTYWMFFLGFMVIILMISSDFSKDYVSPMRLM